MLRVLSPDQADGPRHMCLDEALLDRAQVPTCRLYTWRPATVSLGYFQDYDAISAQLPGAMPVVRRITGGGAIWHEHELTYCLVLPDGSQLPEHDGDAFARLHGAILEQLTTAGARLQCQTHSAGDRRYRDEPRCFASPARDDLIAPEGGKVLGSAGRRRGRSRLIHGSLKLASNPWDGPVVSGCGLQPERAAMALLAGISQAVALVHQPGELSQQEHERYHELLQLRYQDQQWVRSRRGPRA